MLRCCICLVLTLLASSTAAASTGVLPVDATAMGADATRMRLAVVEVTRDVLREQYVAIDDAALKDPRCRETVDCMKGVIARAGVDDAAFMAVRPGPTSDITAVVSVQIYNTDGVGSFTATEALSRSRTTDLKALLLRSFDPQRYLGRVEFTGVGPGEALWIDGVVANTTSTLRPGEHTARINHTDGSTTVFPFTVVFGERVQVAVPRAPREILVVPAVVGATAAVVGGVGVAVGALQLQQAPTGTDTIALVGTIGAGVVAVAGLVVVAVAVSPAVLPAEEIAR